MEILNKKIFTHYFRRRRAGFTLIEVLITMAIFSILVYLASASFIKIQKSRLLNDNLWQIASILRQAQSKAVAGEAVNNDHLYFGVVFTEDNYQEFATLTDFANRQSAYDLTTDLPGRLIFTGFNLPDTCLQPNDCIIFSPIEGIPSADASIILENQVDGERKTIFINEEGKVSF